jgi:hypothetical protein
LHGDHHFGRRKALVRMPCQGAKFEQAGRTSTDFGHKMKNRDSGPFCLRPPTMRFKALAAGIALGVEFGRGSRERAFYDV